MNLYLIKTNAINAIHNNSNLSAMQKVAAYDKIMQSFSNDMTNITTSAEQNLLRFMASSSFDHTTLQEVINQAGQVDPTLTSDIYKSFMAIVQDINNVDLTNKVNAVLNNVTAEADIWPAIATCANIIGVSAIDSYYESKRRKIDINNSRKQKSKALNVAKDVLLDIHDQTELEKATEDLKEKYKSHEIDLYDEGIKNHQNALEEWDQKSPLYRLLHRKEKPTAAGTHLETLEVKTK